MASRHSLDYSLFVRDFCMFRDIIMYYDQHGSARIVSVEEETTSKESFEDEFFSRAEISVPLT